MNLPSGTRAKRLAILVGMAAVYAVMLSRFDLGLLFTDTTLTGGDSASWLQPLKNLRDEFLPRLRFFGYSHSNFYGYLEGQHYFPLPFFSAALLSYFIPITIALKLATVAGAFALPLTTFFGLRSFAKSAWIGLAGAGGALVFLFNEGYTMFGGNFLSTFAGEFCYSWAIALLPLFIASAWKDQAGESWSPRSGLLLGAMGLCHFFVFMVAFFLPFFFAFRRDHLFAVNPAMKIAGKKGKKETKEKEAEAPPSRPDGAALALRIPLTYLIAFALMAFWLLPMLGTRTWSQSITMIWRFQGLLDFARQTIMPAWIGGTILALVVALGAIGGAAADQTRRRGAYLLFGLGACAFYFSAATVLGVPDIRFVPPALIIAIFAAALAMRYALPETIGRWNSQGKVHLQPLLAFVAVLVCSLFAVLVSRNTPAWYNWNYSGYEAKTEWRNLEAMAAAYRGDIKAGRFLWEKQNQNDNRDFGSERGFENLWYFMGRPTSEGIHYGSSFMARASTYLQSSYSLNPVDPEAERIYSIVDPDSWGLRFTQANARHIVVYSDEIKAKFLARPEFKLDKTFGKFSVFEYLAFPASYVEVLDPDNISIVNDSRGGFKTDFYRFFRDYELVRRPFVPASFADADLAGRVALRHSSYDTLLARYGASAEWQDYAAKPSLSPVADESLDSFAISFRTTRPGLPHIIKASYAPGWTSVGGERVYPVAPGFMLIYPKGSEVRLEYRRSAAEWAGLGVTFILLPLFLVLGAVPARALKLTFHRPVFALAFAVFFGAIAVFFVLSLTGTARMTASIERARGLNLFEPRARAEALALVGPYATAKYLSSYDNRLVFDAYRIKAEALRIGGEKERSDALQASLKAHFGHSRDLGRL